MMNLDKRQHVSCKTNSNIIISSHSVNYDLDNCLTGERLTRFNIASRAVTREKLLRGSHFVYRALKEIGYADEICRQAFSVASAYQIPLPQGHISYSNSNNYHVLIYSPNGVCGVDVEEYRNRLEVVYDNLLDHLPFVDKKLAFYQTWLKKEIHFKCQSATQVTYELFNDYLLGYFFEGNSDIIHIYL